MKNQVLKIGDVVELTSGGKSMTVVTQIQEKTGSVKVECAWFEEPFADMKFKKCIFPIEAIIKVKPVAPSD